MPQVHPTAIVDPSAELADDVEVGAYAIVEADCSIGAGTVLRPHTIVRRYTTLGEGNFVDSFTTLGGWPQDLKFDPAQVSYLTIGDRNVFRENVTISRATGERKITTIGSDGYWMACSHAGHNATVGDGVTMVNSALIGGHATLGDGCVLGGNAAIHQFVWVGERVMFQGNAASSMHIPPFIMAAKISRVAGLNSLGMRRAKDLTDEDRAQIKEAFRLTYRSRLTPEKALREMDQHSEWGAAAGRFRDFVRKVLAAEPPYTRGLAPLVGRAAPRLHR